MKPIKLSFKRLLVITLSVMLTFTTMGSIPALAYAADDLQEAEETALDEAALETEESIPGEDLLNETVEAENTDTVKDIEESKEETQIQETQVEEETASEESVQQEAKEEVSEEKETLQQEPVQQETKEEASAKAETPVKADPGKDPAKETPKEGNTLDITLNGTAGKVLIDGVEYALSEGENKIEGLAQEDVEANVLLDKNATSVEINGTKYDLTPGVSELPFSIPAASEIKITAGTQKLLKRAPALKAAPASGTGTITGARSIGSGYSSSWEFDVSFSGNTYTGFCINPYNESIATSGSTSLTLASGNLRRAAYYAYLNYSSWGTAGKIGIHRQLAYYAGYGDDRTGYTDYNDSPEAVVAFVNGSTAVPAEFEAYISIPTNGGQQNLVYRMGEKPQGYAYITKNVTKSSDLKGVGNVADGTYSFTLTGPETKTLTVTLSNGKLTGDSSKVLLKAGTYIVKETSAPSGVTKAKDQTVIVTSSHTSSSPLKITVTDTIIEGKAHLTKSPSKCSDIVNELDTYTLAGAKYEVKNASGTVVHTFVTKADGSTDTVSLPAGKYAVTETAAPKGFKKDNKSYTVTVENGKTATLEVKDVPMLDPIFVMLKKELSNGVTDNNISVKGAEYTYEYYDTLDSIEGKTPRRTWVFATDDKGIIKYDDSYKVSGDELYKNENGIPVGGIGTYVIKETKAPARLSLSEKTYTIKYDGSPNQDVIVDFAYPTDEEKPQTVSLTIHKVDKDTGEAKAQGNGSLAGAVFDVYYFDPATADDVKVDTVTTNSEGIAVSENLMPGLYSIREVTASPGYIVNPDKFDVRARIKEINTANFNYDVTVPEQPITIEIAKLAYDKDGELYNLQGATLQLLDSRGNVIEEWETTEEVKTLKGIVPGDYAIVEKSAPDGFHKVLGGIDIEVKETEEVQYFEMIDEGEVEVKTLAKFDTGVKESLSNGTVTVVDEVEYTGTLPEHPYRFIGKMVNPETDEVVAEGTTDFTTDGVNGKTTVEYTFDAAAFENTAPVIYEYLYRLDRDPEGDNGNNEDTELVGKHEAPDDKDQIVYFPAGKTTAADIIDDEKDALASGRQTIVDIFHYENLEPNSERTVSGKLMVKSTGKALKVNGKEVTAEATFTTTESGTGDVRLEFVIEDASVLNGEDIVAFERVKNKGIDVIVHEDLDDENQTVHFPEIKTTALDIEDDEKDMLAGGTHTVKDIVQYSNLLVGKEYTLNGTAYVINEDGTQGDAIGEGTLTFTPDKKDGEVIVEIEIDTTGLEGRDTVMFEELKRGEKTVGLHCDLEDENQTIHIPEIHTTATDKADGGKEIMAAPEQTVVDEIKYVNLIPGKTYVAHGVFHIVNEDGTDGGILTINGEEVTAEAEFTPDKPEGTAKVEFTFDASTLQGESLVAFEEVTRNGKTVAIHADIEDEAQTVHVPEIRTKALDKESGTNKVVPYWENTIVDTVTFRNLTPGETYEVSGVLVKKADGKETKITGKATFTPDEKDGEAEVTFTFDGTTVEGTTLVVFEELSHDGKIIAEHKDINDEDQTVIIKPIGKITITDKPDFSKYLSPKTGDPTNILIHLGTLASALMLLAFVLRKKTRKADN